MTAADIFTSATTGGARALGHEDLKRITPGAKADFVMVDITHPTMRPLYDPVGSLVYAASEQAIRHVFVGGQQLVRDGKALAFDYAEASVRLEMAHGKHCRRGLTYVSRVKIPKQRYRRSPAASRPCLRCPRYFSIAGAGR